MRLLHRAVDRALAALVEVILPHRPRHPAVAVLRLAARAGWLRREGRAGRRLRGYTTAIVTENRAGGADHRRHAAFVLALELQVLAGPEPGDVDAAFYLAGPGRCDPARILYAIAAAGPDLATWRAMVPFGRQIPRDVWRALLADPARRTDPAIWRALQVLAADPARRRATGRSFVIELLLDAAATCPADALLALWSDLALLDWAAAEELRRTIRPGAVRLTAAALGRVLADGAPAAREGALLLLGEVAPTGGAAEDDAASRGARSRAAVATA